MKTIMSNGYRCDEYWYKQIELCLNIATKSHAGQKDKVGLPVILHPLVVGNMGSTPIEICVGFLHDVIEDTDVTVDNLLNAGVDKVIVDSVMLLTHDPSIDYFAYIQKLIDSDNHIAITVKLNDLSHNQERALAYGFQKQVSKYEKAIRYIKDSCFEWLPMLDIDDDIHNTFLMRWNPEISNFKLNDYKELISQSAGYVSLNWSIHDWLNARVGDKVYMLRTGIDYPKSGLILKGTITSNPELGEDWAGQGKARYYVDFVCDDCVGTMESPIILTTELEATIPSIDWRQGHSGELLSGEQTELLDELWVKRSIEREWHEG